MPNMSELKPFADLLALLKKQASIYLDTVHQCLYNITYHTALNAFIRTYSEEALQNAQRIVTAIEKEEAGKLAGLVVGLKDLLCYKDHPVQASSKILEGFISQFSATCVQRLVEQDAIIIGHQNCDEFGMGSANKNSIFGPVRNAIDINRVAGGSSGGSAVAVQANMCHVSLGTDTGGSVRQPAAFCGIIGLKPTYGRISRHGMIAYASSFDTIGILAKTIYDCAAVLEVIAGVDDFDSTASHQSVPKYRDYLKFDKKVKIAYLKETLEYTGLQEEIKTHTLDTIESLRDAGQQVEGVDFPLLAYALPTYYVLTYAEASSNLARFDGIRYGYRSPGVNTVTELYTKTRSEGFGKEVQKRILLGTFVLGANNYDTCYMQAKKIRRLIKDKLEAILTEYDFILLPTTPSTAFEIESASPVDPLAVYWSDVYTTLASIAGLPAISIPNGTDQKKLPIGLQIIANRWEEADLLGFSNYIISLPKKI